MNRNVVSVTGIITPVVVAILVAWAASDGSERVGGLPAIVWLAILSFVVNWLVFIPSRIKQTEHYYDLTGSGTYITLTIFALIAGGADEWPQRVMGVMILCWAFRLGSFLFMRVKKAGEDTRFRRVKTETLRFLMFWTIQGLWVFLTGAAAYTAMTSVDERGFTVVSTIGVILWVVGFAIEVRADQEKSAFRADPANKGRFISTGIWAWSRHPNYFGEITLWVGIALIALPTLSGWQYVTLISPVFVYILLTRISGLPALERQGQKRWGDEPAYQQYIANTPAVMLRPPRS